MCVCVIPFVFVQYKMDVMGCAMIVDGCFSSSPPHGTNGIFFIVSSSFRYTECSINPAVALKRQSKFTLLMFISCMSVQRALGPSRPCVCTCVEVPAGNR